MVSDAWMEAQNEALESSLCLSSGDTCLLGGWLGGTCIRDCKDSVRFSREDAATADMANPRTLVAMASLPRYVALCKCLIGGSAEQCSVKTGVSQSE